MTSHSTDVEIVAAAYEYWRSDCFARLIGDWALSIWDANTRSLILAKDPIGTRHLTTRSMRIRSPGAPSSIHSSYSRTALSL